MTRRQLESKALYQVLMDSGVVLGRVVQEITAEIADPVKAILLETDIGSPLLRINRLVHDADGNPVQHLSIHLTPDRSRILMDIPAEDLDTAAAGLLAHDVSRSEADRGAVRQRSG